LMNLMKKGTDTNGEDPKLTPELNPQPFCDK
jgi:hypothetical protein